MNSIYLHPSDVHIYVHASSQVAAVKDRLQHRTAIYLHPSDLYLYKFVGSDKKDMMVLGLIEL